ncbi:MAG: antitoxin family protein [Chloroflexi bacterium]|nr:antitoxin family protein [Chloroflexota bacterium]
MMIQSVTAIYQKGVLKPARPLNLAENERVEVRVTQSEKNDRPVLSLSGIWRGLGDPSYEEIVALTHGANQARMERLVSMLTETGT